MLGEDVALRERRGRLVPGAAGGSALRAAGRGVADGAGRPEAAQVARLIAQIGRLSVSIARLREA